ncbi:acyl-CoA dehydrogenase [Nonomuraea sp. NPDC047897]|uniref:acyl-CoA dehydrogenase n=1 Tax=Nonomuraea sp. NPDC047897 TaxID=3364346 RepID=UPI0037203CB1
MRHYRSHVRDIEFNLFEVLGIDEIIGPGSAFPDLDREVCRSALAEVARLAEGPLAESFADADRNPPVFDPETGTVTLPASVKEAYATLRRTEWWRLEAPHELGGVSAPRALVWGVAELVLGANPVVHLYGTGVPFSHVVYGQGTPQQQAIARHMIDRDWGATMALTEADAGSDVGAARARAVPQADGTWHVEGVKRFITSAEHDLTENIVHLVLARPEGARAGTKGLSLFIVPKLLFDLETGEPLRRNGVRVTNLEHKMGLKGSTTCELRFGEDGPAIGYLLGDVHDGIAQMFHVIEHTRMMVGVKAISALSTGYLNALEYAKSRVQSADLARMGDTNAPRVPIINHPDVRRSLMLLKGYAEGLRALALYTSTWQDKALLDEHEGADDGLVKAVSALLLPIVKGVGSERSYEQLAHALQVFGGSGYLQDYPLEQYVRDTKVDSLYEGTTAIQGQDLFFRKIVRNEGVAFDALLAEIDGFLRTIASDDRLRREHDALLHAVESCRAMVDAMLRHAWNSRKDPCERYKAGQHTTRLLMAMGDLMVAYLLVRQAHVAEERLRAGGLSPGEHVFYEGKLGVARFFTTTVLPHLAVHRTIVETTDNELMEIVQDAF